MRPRTGTCGRKVREGRDATRGPRRRRSGPVAAGGRRARPWELVLPLALLSSALQAAASGSREPPQSAYFLPEFALSPQGSFQEDASEERLLTYRHDDQPSRTTRSDEDRQAGWDAWGAWSDCSRTCGGGASYSLRRCLSGSCEGGSIRYRTCSNADCPVDAGDFRAQQCSAHNDVKYQGRAYEWVPAAHDPAAPCALRCRARGQGFVVELAPKVLDGTRCRADSLDMCINGLCEEVGCDRRLGSNAREDDCGVCAGDGSTCRLTRGQALSHVSAEETVKTVVEIPVGSRDVRVTAKGPDLVIVETRTLQGHREEHVPGPPGTRVLGNTSVELRKGLERVTLRAPGPLAADFIVKVKDTAPRNTLVQFAFYQPIRYQWRETDFFPCTATCGGGYQLTSAECADTRLNRVVPDQHCNLYPENKKPKPKLRECNLDLCPESDGFKEVMAYDQFQPLPHWEPNPWTTCSASCGGGARSRSVACVEEDAQGRAAQAEEWKCAHSSRPAEQEDCNTFACPHWAAMEWSQCTVTCGRGLRYRVVLCLDHRGQHAGGCDAGRKPHVKEDCLVPVACHRPRETLPVEAKVPWRKLARELEEPEAASEEPTFVSGPWLPCSASCGPGRQSRRVKCGVLLPSSRTAADLPDEECGEARPSAERRCNLGSCAGTPGSRREEPRYTWEHVGFAACSSPCAAGTQEAVVRCLRLETREAVDESFCSSSRRPLAAARVCNPHPCPPRWESGPWTRCTATCGVGVQTRSVRCRQLRSLNPADAVAAPDAECPGSKPSELRACNRVDCPAAWHADEWQQCSHTCGGGTQSRKVHCKQRLSAAGFRNLPDTSCPGAKPAAHKPCARTSCPPRTAAGHWSKCSVSCGAGVRRREPAHRRVTPVPTACSGFPLPPLPEPKKAAKPKQPCILGLPRVCVRLTVGGRACLQPGTSAAIKCPVRRFQKHRISWEKDDEGPIPSGRLGITGSGSPKFRGLEAAHVGVCCCVAGPASEAFVRKLSVSGGRLAELPKGTGAEVTPRSSLAKQEPGRSHDTWQSRSRNNELYLGDSRAREHEEAFLQVVREHLTGAARPPDTRPALSVLRGGRGPEPRHLKELPGNVSPAGERTNARAAGERPASGGEAAPSTVLLDGTAGSRAGVPAESKAPCRKPAVVRQKLYPGPGFRGRVATSVGQNAVLPDGAPQPNITRSKDGARLQVTGRVFWDHTGALRTSEPRKGDGGVYRCTAAHELGSDTRTSQLQLAEAPSIAAAASRRDESDAETLEPNAVVGGSVTVRRGANLALLRPVSGFPTPDVTWGRAEGPLTPNCVPQPGGSLLIRAISFRDAGTYVCSAANPFGTSLASNRIRVVDPTARGRLPFRSGSHTKALMASRLGTNITVRPGERLRIGCPIHSDHGGAVSWSFQNRTLQGVLGPRYRVLAAGRALEVNPLSGRSAGIYGCRSSIRSRPVSAWVRVSVEACRVSCGSGGVQSRRLRRASAGRRDAAHASRLPPPRPAGPSRPCNARDCPPSWEATVWSPCSVSCGRGFRQRRARCRRRHVAWRTSPWGRCSGRCVGPGLAEQSRPVACQRADGSSLPESHCDRRTRPASARNCTWEACANRWRMGPWWACSVDCGGGFRSRRVRCVHGRTGRILADRRCAWQLRPAAWQHCSVMSCDGVCRDSTRYCSAAKRLQLCRLDLYKQRCCQTCQEEAPMGP